MTEDEILRELRSTITQRRRAELEVRLFESMTPTMRRVYWRNGKCDLASVLVRAHPGEIDWDSNYRARLYRAGEVADPLWRLIEAGEIAVRTAARILSEARTRSTEKGTEFEVEIEQGLAAWKDRSVVVRSKVSGKVHRRRVDPRSLPTAEDAVALIRSAAKVYVEAHASHVEDVVRRELVAEAVAELDAFLLAFQGKVRRLEKQVVDQEEARRRLPFRAVREACETLTIASPAAYGRPVDMEEARKRFKALVRRYHPDVSGTPKTRPLFEGVVAAMKDLEVYEQDRVAVG